MNPQKPSLKPSPQKQTTGLAEADFYLGMIAVGGAEGADAVKAPEEGMAEAVKELKTLLGPHSMILRLALGQHSRLLHAGLAKDLATAEALFKQHLRLQARSGRARKG